MELAPRIQSVKEFKGALSHSMIFSFLFLNVDCTPFACLEKEEIIMKIEESFDPTEKESWFDLIRLFQNAYFTYSNFYFIFNVVARIIGFPPIEIDIYDDILNHFVKTR